MAIENEPPQLNREQQELIFDTFMEMAERKAALVRRLEAVGEQGEGLARARWSAESAYRCAEMATQIATEQADKGTGSSSQVGQQGS